MAYLRDVDLRLPIWSLDTQQLLWDGYMGKTAPIGISAFPSMHNASTLLFALAAWPRSRGLGVAFAIYTAIILVESVHLGWHYAVDGYGGLALAACCWWLAGFAARWHHRRPGHDRLNEGLALLSGAGLGTKGSQQRVAHLCPPTTTTSTRMPPISSR